MRRLFLISLLLIALVAIMSSLAAGEGFQIETAPAASAADLPKSLLATLDPHGVRLVSEINGLKTTICELWWKKAVLSRAISKSPDLLYGELTPGAVIGVLHFPEFAESEIFRRDFRDQRLKPGFYLLRYAQIVQDKELADERNQRDEDEDDNRISPFRDFAVLTPLSADDQPDRVLTHDELFRLGRLASGGKNPALLSLVQVNPAYKNFPAVVPEDTGNCTLQIMLRAKPAKGGREKSLPLAILFAAPHSDLGES